MAGRQSTTLALSLFTRTEVVTASAPNTKSHMRPAFRAMVLCVDGAEPASRWRRWTEPSFAQQWLNGKTAPRRLLTSRCFLTPPWPRVGLAHDDEVAALNRGAPARDGVHRPVVRWAASCSSH